MSDFLLQVQNKGVNYKVTSTALNESKFDFIVTENTVKQSKHFGLISTAIKFSTNDLGNGALNITSIIKIRHSNQEGFYLIPDKENLRIEKPTLNISHRKKPKKVFKEIKNASDIFNTTEKFIEEIDDLKRIKTPDELRTKILFKITNRNSPFKEIRRLRDIFTRKIDNEINNFSKLLEMCNKAEELELEFELKDKLRYIISDIILYGNSKSR